MGWLIDVLLFSETIKNRENRKENGNAWIYRRIGEGLGWFSAFLTGVNSQVSLVEMSAPCVFAYVFVVSYIHALFKLAEVSFASLSSTTPQALY